jgi:glycosyltransferase involved in cell wall biosynthesis
MTAPANEMLSPTMTVRCARSFSFMTAPMDTKPYPQHPMPRLLHVTTTDISLELLLGPQLRAFQAEGYEVHTASAPGPFVATLEADGIVHHPLRHATRATDLRSDAKALVELYRLFRRLRPDIVHTHNPKPGVYGRIAARLARVPLVVNTQHGLYAQPQDRWARKLPVYVLERVAAAFSHAELVQNEEDVATLLRLRVPAGKVQVLGNGIDLERFKPDLADRAEVRAELGINDGTTAVGAVGRLVWEKGYAELFDAAKAILSQRDDVAFVIAGPFDADKGDPLSPADVAAAEAAGVRFVGHRDDPERLYQAFDVYVLASHREGFPRSAMEAAATGLPIVACDIRGCRQVVDHGTTGLLGPVRDPIALQRNIERLLDDADLRTRMSEAATGKAKRDFDQQTVIDRTLATYRS